MLNHTTTDQVDLVFGMRDPVTKISQSGLFRILFEQQFQGRLCFTNDLEAVIQVLQMSQFNVLLP